MVCPKCGANIIEGDNFCEDCGASIKNISRDGCDALVKKMSSDGCGTSIKKMDSDGCACQDCKVDIKSDIVVVDAYLAVASNIGRKHPKNEDAGTVIKCENGSVILAVADGVSSAVNATSASLHAISTVREVLTGESDIGIDLIKTAISKANDIILGLPSEIRPDGIYGPETTIVTAVVVGDKITICWVGDSRAYIIGETMQELLTTDDSWIELVVASGEMTRGQATVDKRAHYVTQVLGMHDQPMEVHSLEHKLEEGQMLLLCSDGLWNYMQGDNDLLKAVIDFGIEKDAIAICEYLVELANNAGGHDNITVAILKKV